MKLIEHFRQFDYRLWILALGWIASAFGFAVSLPYVAIYFHSELGISMSRIGLFFGVTAILRGLSQAYGGELSDKFGRYYPMLLAQLMRTLVLLVTAYAIFHHWGFYNIALLIVINSIFGAQFQPAANAAVADLVGPEKRTEGYSIVRMAGNFGWSLGPIIGGIFAEKSFGLLFLISAGATLMSSIIIGLFLRNIRAVRFNNDKFSFKEMAQYRGNETIFKFTAIIFIMYLVVSQFMAPFSLYTVEYMGITKSQLGVIFGINGLMVTLFQLPATWLVKKFRLTTQLVIGAFIYIIGYMFTGWAELFWGFLAAIVIITIGEMVVSPAAMTIPANLAPKNKIGRYMGIYGFAVTFGWSLGPMIGGVLLDMFKPNFIYFWFIIAGTALIAAALFGLFGRVIPPEINLFKKNQ